MKPLTTEQIILTMCLDIAGKVNHDLLGSMHVVNFCAEEMASLQLQEQPGRFKDYSAKLRHSTQQMSESIRLSRLVVNTLKPYIDFESEPRFPLQDSFTLAAGLSHIFQRHLPALKIDQRYSKKTRHASFSLPQVLVLSFIFDWMAGQFPQHDSDVELSVVIEDLPDSEMLQFSVPAGVVKIESIPTDFIQPHHPLYQYLASCKEESFLNIIAKDRDIIGLLRERECRDYFYFHVDLFSRAFNRD